MAEIAFILLCHKDPAGIIRQVERLTEAGDCVAIHFDARAPRPQYLALRAAFASNPRVVFAKKRVKCGWGEWSLVDASLAAIRAAVAAFPLASHFYMISGDCQPIKTAVHVRARLDAEDCDYIESFDFFQSDWIRTGLKAERLTYRHYFNERRHKRLFYGALALQQRLRLEREIPGDLGIMIGSQWWCLRRRTIERVLAFCAARPDVVRFFKTTWIPDETFFQTLVRHLVPAREIQCRTLTFLMFTDYGMPATFYNDHYDHLVAQDYLFARKISAEARDLRERLGALYGGDQVDFPPGADGRRLRDFLSARGREGRRFGPRAWDRGGEVGAGQRLYVVICKKWHVGKRLVAAIGRETGMPVAHYLFSEDDAGLPAMGGTEATVVRRSRHRRAFLNLLMQEHGADRLAIGVDPADMDLIRDLAADPAQVRFLDVGCRFTDAYLEGHARRVGLLSDHAGAEELATLLPVVRHDVVYERARLRQVRPLWHLDEGAPLADNARALADYLAIPFEKAQAIAATAPLFDD